MVAAQRVTLLSELEQDHDGFDVSEASVVAALHRAEDRHFWFVARNEWIAQRLGGLGLVSGARVIELGCGGGCVASHLSRCGYEIVGVDGHRQLVNLASKRAKDARFWVHDLSRGIEALPERDFDAVGLFDVIEHLDDPRQALQKAVSLARPGGLVVGTVPALLALWSELDVRAGHRRRYGRAQLRDLVDSVEGAERVELVYFNRVLVPMMWLQRRVVARATKGAATSLANLAVPVWPMNWGMKTVLRVERRIGGMFDRLSLVGASLWFALRRVKSPG